MSKVDTEVIVGVAQKFIRFRNDFKRRAGNVQQGEVREFVEQMNTLSTEFVNALDIRDVEILEAMVDMGNNFIAQQRMPDVMRG